MGYTIVGKKPEPKPEPKRYVDLAVGETFTYSGCLYLKVKGYGQGSAFNLTNKEISWFTNEFTDYELEDVTITVN